MLSDVRLAWRSLVRAPIFSLTAILTVALAVGANTAIFSIADAVLFRPLPYGDPDHLFVVQSMDPSSSRRFASVRWPHLRGIRNDIRSLSDVATVDAGPSLVALADGRYRDVPTAAVSANYFEILNVRATRGRLFVPSDAGNTRAAVLSYDAWISRFGGDERIVGQAASFGAARYDIIGVLPRGFAFTPTPFVQRPQVVVLHDPSEANPGVINPVVRLERGATREQASAELTALARSINQADRSLQGSIPVLQDLRSLLFPAGGPIMRFLLAASILVLLIGSANLASIFLARARRRERDAGVRSALGASRARLIRPVAIEAALIGLTGAALAVIVTRLTFDALVRQVPPIAYSAAQVGVDGRVTLFGLALGAVSGALFAGGAAWRTSRLDAMTIIQRRSAGTSALSRRFGAPMVATQAALAIMLVFGASLAARALVSVLSIPLAFDPANVATIRVSPGLATGSERQTLYRELVDAIVARPDVLAAGAAASMLKN